MTVARIAGLLLLAAGAVLIFMTLLRLIRALQSLRWPLVTGKISRSSVEVHHHLESGDDHQAMIYAAYSVDGNDHEVLLTDASNANIYSKKAAKQQVARYKVGTPVQIRYHPTDPAKAALASFDFVKHLLARGIGGTVVFALGLYITLTI